MAIPLIGSSTALFHRLGRVGKVALLAGTCQTGIVAQITDIVGRYTGEDEFLTGSLAINRDSLTRGVATGLMNQLRALAQATLTEMVREDQPARVADPVAELIRQMLASGDTVPKCTVSASAAADGTNTGDLVAVVTSKRGDGRDQENMVAEAGRLTVASDSRTGGQTAGAELLRYTGVANPAGVWDWDYPQGSGATRTFNAADAYTGRNSVLRNGGWDAWTAGVPDRWTATGTLAEETGTVFGSGAKAVKVVAGDTATLSQTFALSSQTASRLNPLSSLGFALRVRGSATLSGGTLAVSLVDGSGTTLLDDLGATQSASFNLNGVVHTAWTAKTGTLRTPRILPSSYAIKVTVTTPGGGNLFLDHIAAQAPTALYTGGPSVAGFGGATAALIGDGWTLTTANDRAGATYGLTWQSVAARLFGDGLILPSSASPTIADTLISS